MLAEKVEVKQKNQINYLTYLKTIIKLLILQKAVFLIKVGLLFYTLTL